MGIIESIVVLITDFMALAVPLFNLLASILLIIGGLLLIAASMVVFVIRGIYMLKIAKKLKVKQGWMSFFAVLCYYPMGRIAEECEKSAKPAKKPFALGMSTFLVSLATCIVALGEELLLLGGPLLLVLGTLSMCTVILIPVGLILVIVGAFSMVLLPVGLLICVLLYPIMLAVNLIVYILAFAARYKTYKVLAKSRATSMMVADVLISILLYPVALGELGSCINYALIASKMDKEETVTA